MRFLMFCIVLCLFFVKVGWTISADSLKFVNAENFVILGKGFVDKQNVYCRLPSDFQSKTRPSVWSLSKNCSGLAIRFRTNSSVVAAKWEVTGDVSMNHFAPSGIKGLDLYSFKNGKWQFVNSARPAGKTTSTIIIDHMAETEREYLLYLPLYDGLVKLEIGVKSTASIEQPLIDSPQKAKPLVFYGTSITQGGCASRAGMSYPNQLSRMLDRQIINLGFSGNGQLDLEIAEFIASLDASCLIIDCIPNVTLRQMNEKYVRFLEIIREKKPDLPILFVESILFPHMKFDQSIYEIVHDKNARLKEIYSAQKKKGDRNIFYMKADKIIGKDGEATVDGIHLTDLGFLRMSQELYPILCKFID